MLLECIAKCATAVHETIRVKSAAWDDNGVLIYTTLNHVKYCLHNGDSGIVRTLENPIYITKVFGDTLYCLDRDGKHRQIPVRALAPLAAPLMTLYCMPVRFNSRALTCLSYFFIYFFTVPSLSHLLFQSPLLPFYQQYICSPGKDCLLPHALPHNL